MGKERLFTQMVQNMKVKKKPSVYIDNVLTNCEILSQSTKTFVTIQARSLCNPLFFLLSPGAWVDDQRSGVGKYTYVNGDSYDGEWLNHVRNGQVGL